MNSFSHPYCRSLLGISLILLAESVNGEDVTSLADRKDVLNTLPIELTTVFDFKIPPRPDGHVLDTAHFLTVETKQSLEDELSLEARNHGVNIYLLTVPSVQKNALEPFTQKVSQTWTKGLFGATLVFDDGTGKVAIQQSEDVAKRFYEFELSLLLKDTNNLTKRPKLSRDGLENTTKSVKTALHELKMRANREDRKSRLTMWGTAIIGAVAAFFGVFGYLHRRSGTEPV